MIGWIHGRARDTGRGLQGRERVVNRIMRVGLAIALSGAVGTIAGCGGDPDVGASPVRIGAVLSLTGTYAALGESEKEALELEVERINASGGIDGVPVEIIIEDDATDEAKAVAAASKLIEQDRVVALIAATGTGQTMAMRGDVDRAGIAQVSMAGGTVVTADFDENVFQTPWSNTLVVPFVLERIAADGHARIALLTDSGGYGKDGRDVIRSTVGGAGLELVADETFNPGDADLTAQLTRIKGSQADAVLMWTAGREAAVAVRSARELGMALPFYGGSGQARTEFIEGAGDAAEGFVFGTGKSLVPANWGEGSEQYSVVDDFASRYEQAYGVRPDIFAGHAFDAFSIVIAALKGVGSDASPAELRDAIEQTEDLVGFGGVFTFSPTDHNGLAADDLNLYRVEGGTWVPVR